MVSRRAQLWRWAVAMTTCWCLWINHYSRDITGALEKEIENDLHAGKEKFQALNTVYFLPNIFMPTIMGLCVSKRFGAPVTMVVLTAINLTGNLLVAGGASYVDYSPVLSGRIITGLSYESIDMGPIPILTPLFPDSMGLVVGLFNSMLRCGSVANFILSPLLYQSGGLSAAMWVSALFAGTGLLAACTLIPMSRKAKALLVAPEDGLLASGASGGAENPGAWLKPGWTEYIIYTVCGACLYSSIVPFWFYGGGFIRDKWKYDLVKADSMVLLAEGGMAVISPFIGKLMDCLPTPSAQVGVLAVMSMFVPISLATLAYVPDSVPPIYVMVFLSVSVACTIPAFWSLCGRLLPPEHLDLCGGLLGSSLNLGGTLLPFVMAKAHNDTLALMLLAGFAFLTSCVAVVLWARLRWLKMQADAARAAAQCEMAS